MKRTFTSVSALLMLVLLALASTACEKLKARDHLNKGVHAFRNANYPEAVEHFKQAIELDPTFSTSRLYLANAYMVQYIPGAESPENLRMAEAAHDQFLQVLNQDPNNTVALASIALLYFNQKKFEEAQEWYNKLITVDPSNKEAHYTLGVIAWTKSFEPRMAARAKLGMRPEDPGPIRDRKVREELKAEHLPVIEEGMHHLNRALEIDNEYDDAMAYLNLLYRERADLHDAVEAYKSDIETADNWVQKTLETKKIKAARVPTGVVTRE
jgi:tetratricopeptide (TPR) repeat protein